MAGGDRPRLAWRPCLRATSPRPPDLHGRTAVVTGGASGIGAAVAARLAEAGASIIVVDRDADGAERVADLVRGKALALDLSDGEAVTAAMEGIDADILVNNAGIQHVAPIVDFDPAMFTTIHAVMLAAPFRLARALLPGMYARGWGRLVHVSSVHGHRASAYKSAYVSAKHGLEGLSKVIALEAAEHGVTSNTVCPGYVRTPLVEGQIADQATHPRHPRGRGRREGPARALSPQAPRRARRGRRGRQLPVHRCRPFHHRHLPPDGRRLDRRLSHVPRFRESPRERHHP